MADHQDRPVQSTSWLMDRAAETNLLASDMTVPEAKRDMRILSEIYRRWAERIASRSGQRKVGSTS
jgi:hypothetical protein